MFRNIETEIFMKQISKRDIADRLGITYNTLLLKLSGKATFTLDEAMLLKDILQSNLSIEELFSRTDAA